MRTVLEKLVGLLFPSYCLKCKKGDGSLCKKCLLSLYQPCSIGPGVFSLFPYKDVYVKELIWRMKLKNDKSMYQKIAEILAEFLKTKINKNEFIVTTIPSHRTSSASRKYNHMSKMCHIVCSQLNFQYSETILIRTKEVKKQALIKERAVRIKAPENTLRASTRKRYQDVLIIDDVTTTGATFREAKRALEEAGYKNVLCLAIAH